MPCRASFCASSFTRTCCAVPPMVNISRVPGTRFNSASRPCAICSKSKLLRSLFSAAVSSNHKVMATIGTSSMPLVLIIGWATPRLRGNQSCFENILSYRRNIAWVLSSPTVYSTVKTLRPGLDIEYTCLTPLISDRACSAGTLTRLSTSLAEAPGNAIKTLAKVTSICGSSSRGVTSTANTPSNKASKANKNVISVCKKARAMRPEIPNDCLPGFSPEFSPELSLWEF